jgi:hypothetical protein
MVIITIITITITIIVVMATLGMIISITDRHMPTNHPGGAASSAHAG